MEGMGDGDGLQANPEILRRVWGQILPIASDHYDSAIERMARSAPAYNRLKGDHVLEFVEGAWRSSVHDSRCIEDMLRSMQQTLLTTADAVKSAMDRYVATDEASAMRLAAAHFTAAETSGPPPLDPDLELGL
jgi:hypothetical protein